jgi:hypothetical protein
VRRRRTDEAASKPARKRTMKRAALQWGGCARPWSSNDLMPNDNVALRYAHVPSFASTKTPGREEEAAAAAAAATAARAARQREDRSMVRGFEGHPKKKSDADGDGALERGQYTQKCADVVVVCWETSLLPNRPREAAQPSDPWFVKCESTHGRWCLAVA